MRKISADEIMKGITKAKFAWIDKTFKSLLPARIYRGMHHAESHEIAMKWIEERGYRVEDKDGVVKVIKGVRVLASMQPVLEINSMEELRRLEKMAMVKYPGQT